MRKLSSADRKPREMQLFLLGYIIVEICEIFTVGEFPLDGTVRVVYLPGLLDLCSSSNKH